MRFFRPVPRISLSEPADAPELAQLLGVEVPEVEAWMRGGFEVYKATLDGKLVGSIRCAFPTGACVIDRLVVDPGHRRRGFGEYLAEHAVSRARRAGASKVWAQVPEGRAEATRILSQLGFEPTGAAGETLRLLELRL
ncbi:MAG TPA: GNAT family N-acetyltransferase [Candidatus Dormibacteraeota bacterium]